MESHENAVSLSALSGNQEFQDPETGRLTDCAGHQVINLNESGSPCVVTFGAGARF
jgi:hypothetical protein